MALLQEAKAPVESGGQEELVAEAKERFHDLVQFETTVNQMFARAVGREAQPGEDGNLLVRSRQLMLGYFNRPDATAEAIDAAAWLHTGDIGRIDERGRLTWVGRYSDIYNCSGFNVASPEVEACLSRHPAVAEVAVQGVPDASKGEVGAAFIIAKEGSTVSLTEIRDFCAGQIASYKIPGHVYVQKELPKTASGKVRKVELKGFFLEQYASGDGSQ